MSNNWLPQDQVLWPLELQEIQSCKQDMFVDIAIIGGGMAGLSAAYELSQRGLKPIIIEQSYCGGGASGKSSGFITPNAELSLTDLMGIYPIEIALSIWTTLGRGLEFLRTTIHEHSLSCGYSEQDTLILASLLGDLKVLEREYRALKDHNNDANFYTRQELARFINSPNYYGAVRYNKSFGINAYEYCQGLKKVLQQRGVQVFEQTPALSIQNNTINTPHAKIKAEQIIVCVDRFLPNLSLLEKQVYHAQTFLMASPVLSDEQISSIFPEKNYMCWDTEFIYNYFRITHQKRLLVGGGSMLTTYATRPLHEYRPMVEKLTHYWAKNFPQLPLTFEYTWPGLIGLSKDIFPIAGQDKDNKHIYYVAASAGLHIAAALGKYAIESILDGRKDLDPYLSPYRPFFIEGALQSVLGTRASFALSHLIKKNIP